MALQKEIWRDVKRYEGKYQVSNFGRVKSLARRVWNGHAWWTQPEKVLKPYVCRNGYLEVSLSDGHYNQKKYRIHRLVATAFISNPNNFPVVNHKDENRQNNNVENLEWCTTMYNTHYGNHLKKLTKIRRKPEFQEMARKNGKKASRRVIQLTLDGKFVREWESMSAAARSGKFKVGGISDCCKHKIKYHDGYKWEYCPLRKD